jgi:hypothetical protein
MAGIIETTTLTQVGFVVNDIEKTKEKFARFFGCPAPAHFSAGEYETTRTTIEGKAAPEANCLLAFFDVGPNVQLELIQPNEVPSVWRDYLNEHGEGIHHIAFHIKDMEGKLLACERFGMKCLQRGCYGDASGEYAYVDGSSDLKCIIELLENYPAKK